jgi:hypothetical protein
MIHSKGGSQKICYGPNRSRQIYDDNATDTPQCPLQSTWNYGVAFEAPATSSLKMPLRSFAHQLGGGHNRAALQELSPLCHPSWSAVIRAKRLIADLAAE